MSAGHQSYGPGNGLRRAGYNEHCKRWVVEHLEEEEDCTSSIDVQVTPDVQPGNVKNVYDGVADVDTSEYGAARHPWSAEKRPGINDPQCLPDVDDAWSK